MVPVGLLVKLILLLRLNMHQHGIRRAAHKSRQACDSIGRDDARVQLYIDLGEARNETRRGASIEHLQPENPTG
jgi:hypothetical protein